MSISLWRRTNALGTLTCDTAIIGAGIAGLSAALHLQRRGLDALIIERHGVGAGASSRNAGFLMRGAADNYAAAVRDWGRPMAQVVWRATELNLEGLRALGIGRLVTYQAVPSCLVAFEEEELAELRESVELLREDGFRVNWADRGMDSFWSHAQPLGGLLNPGDASINPVEMLVYVRGLLMRPVLEQQEVIEIREESGGVHILTSDAVVVCRRVLVCTNAYAGTLLPQLAKLVVPNRGQKVALHAPGMRLDASYYANHGGEYFRQPAPDVITLGGWRRFFEAEERTMEDRVTPEVQGGLEAFGEKIFGRRLPVIARWSGTMGFTPDGLPLVGPVPGYSSRNVWFCGGFTGHGMSLGFQTANHAVSAMLGEEQPIFPLDRLAG